MSTSICPLCRCQRVSLPFPSAPWHLMASHLLEWHLVVSLWLAPKCPPAVILPAQQLDQLLVARVSLALAQECTLHRLLVIKVRWMCSGTLLQSTSTSSFSRFARATVPWCPLLPASCPHLQVFGRASHQMGSRTWLDQHQPTTPSEVVSSEVF